MRATVGRSLAKREADGRQSRETKTREQFCAHPLCHRLMGITDEQILAERDKPGFEAPAMVRISFMAQNPRSRYMNAGKTSSVPRSLHRRAASAICSSAMATPSSDDAPTCQRAAALALSLAFATAQELGM